MLLQVHPNRSAYAPAVAATQPGVLLAHCHQLARLQPHQVACVAADKYGFCEALASPLPFAPLMGWSANFSGRITTVTAWLTASCCPLCSTFSSLKAARKRICMPSAARRKFV